jgi:hypothetical protein
MAFAAMSSVPAAKVRIMVSVGRHPTSALAPCSLWNVVGTAVPSAVGAQW